MSNNKLGDFFQVFVAFSEYMNFIQDSFFLQHWNRNGANFTLQIMPKVMDTKKEKAIVLF